jgi:hypothetical protein
MRIFEIVLADFSFAKKLLINFLYIQYFIYYAVKTSAFIFIKILFTLKTLSLK